MRKINAETIKFFQDFTNSKKNSFRGNYSWKYGMYVFYTAVVVLKGTIETFEHQVRMKAPYFYNFECFKFANFGPVTTYKKNKMFKCCKFETF